jgi:hypothetical protein
MLSKYVYSVLVLLCCHFVCCAGCCRCSCAGCCQAAHSATAAGRFSGNHPVPQPAKCLAAVKLLLRWHWVNNVGGSALALAGQVCWDGFLMQH